MKKAKNETIKKGISLLNLRRGFEPVEKEIKEEWDRIFMNMTLFGGENLKAFEQAFAKYLGVDHAFGVASGTDSLTLGLIANRIGPGDEVIIHANAFVAAVEAMRIAGAKPVLVDMAENGFGPDPEEIKEKISKKTKGIIIVHMYGHPMHLGPVLEICRKYELKLIEDCSHAHGAEYKGRRVGTFGQTGCFSCGVVKNLNAYGDAGVVVTNDDAVARFLNYLRVHGQVKKNDHRFYGFNSRLDELQAAVLKIKLKALEEKNAVRRTNADRYRKGLADLKDIQLPPEDCQNCRSVYHHFVIRTPYRDALTAHLKSQSVGFGIHYPVPLHLQSAWDADQYGSYHLPRAEKAAREILSLPVYPELKDDEIDYIIEVITEFFENK